MCPAEFDLVAAGPQAYGTPADALVDAPALLAERGGRLQTVSVYASAGCGTATKARKVDKHPSNAYALRSYSC